MWRKKEKWTLNVVCSRKNGQQNTSSPISDRRRYVLICQESIAVFKDYNLSRHFSSKHSNYAVNLSPAEKANKPLKLATNLKARQNTFTKQCSIQESVTKASYVVAHKIAKHSKPFSDGEFVKDCMVETADILCPGSKS